MSVNAEIARLLDETAEMMELLEENPFRVNAIARAARIVSGLGEDLSKCDRAALLKIDGIGERVADKIIEYCTTGRIREHEEYAAKIPPGLLDILRIPGVGPKTVRAMWTTKGVQGIDDLKRIIDDGTILELPRMGKKAVEKIKAAIEFAAHSGDRIPLGLAMPAAEMIVEALRAVPGAREVAYAGSLRRGRDTVGDIDIVASADDPKKLAEAFRTLPGVTHVLAAGETKSSVRLRLPSRKRVQEVQVDLRIVPAKSFGAALLYFTGSKDHNVRLRERALKAGYTLNEYGLYPEDTSTKTPPQQRGVKPVAARTEEEIYAALELPCYPPEIREDAGEFLFERESLPRFIELADIKSELHAHTTASDGAMSIAELAAEAKRRGFHTVAVTDHSKSQAIAGGLSPERLREHIVNVRAANETIKGITILAGTEVDILIDGRLDYEDDLLAELDIVVASPHWSLTQKPEQATKRLLKAIEHPLVDIIGHPTGRVLGKREGLKPDITELVAAAKEHNTALEINAIWRRLDLRDSHVRVAVEAGVLIAINCDTHRVEDMDHLRYGVMTARRGWLTAEQCVNTWTAARLKSWLRKRRGS